MERRVILQGGSVSKDGYGATVIVVPDSIKFTESKHCLNSLKSKLAPKCIDESMLCVLLAKSPIQKVKTSLVKGGHLCEELFELRKLRSKSPIIPVYLPPPLPPTEYYEFCNISFALCGKLSKFHHIYEKKVYERGGLISNEGGGANVVVIKSWDLPLPKSQKFNRAIKQGAQIMSEEKFRCILRLDKDSEMELDQYYGKPQKQYITNNIMLIDPQDVKKMKKYDWMERYESSVKY